VVGVFIFVYQAHVQRHQPRIVGRYQHPRLVFLFGQRFASQRNGVAAFGKGYQFLRKRFLLGRLGNVVQDFVFLRAVYAYILCRAEIGNFVVEACEFKSNVATVVKVFGENTTCKDIRK
jgi:hypothetical protein